MTVTIKEVISKSDLKKFVKFNNNLYKDCKYHVPDLIDGEVDTLSRDKNPAFEHCDSIYYLAYKDNKIVGRIAGIVNHKANEIWNQQYARFGFVDFIDDNEVVDALFDAVEKWAAEKRMNAIHGPLGFTDFDHEGMLVEGFDLVGTMATTYTYPYYPEHLERLGYKKDADWNEFHIQIPKEIPERHARISEIVLKKYGLKILKFKNAKEVRPYARKIFELLNESFAPLYGYSSLTAKQIDYYVDMYIPLLRLELVPVVIREADDEIVGVGICLPNLSLALKKAKGHMFPFGWIHLLRALYGKSEVVDLYLAGVLPEYQSKGVNALLFYDLIPVFNKIGYKYAESNIELESNQKVQSQWKYFDTKHVRTRRAFIKHL
ncbi:hypothetical protein LJB98_00405 [Bacteroidales bacterium OttesenSCG-928-M11]|nr:hypothetical protein [Bacteroidales bacterium OttesenSCG-928-M11]